MPNLDQFESAFKAAAREAFVLDRPEFEKVLVVSDLEVEPAEALVARVKAFLRALGSGVQFHVLPAEQSKTIEQLLGIADEHRPDLLVTYRNLHSQAWHWPYSLGKHLDVLCQATELPVLVLPHPQGHPEALDKVQNTDRVLAITDRLAGDSRLVNNAIAFTQPSGTLYLSHIENARDLARVIEAISRIPSVDTDAAKEHLLEQLLKHARDYISECRRVIDEAGLDLQVEEIVATGHPIEEFKRIIHEQELDLLVLNTKDAQQAAMRGPSYAVAIEIRDTPLLLL